MYDSTEKEVATNDNADHEDEDGDEDGEEEGGEACRLYISTQFVVIKVVTDQPMSSCRQKEEEEKEEQEEEEGQQAN